MIRRIVSTAALVSALAAPLLVAAPAQAIPACKAGYQCDRVYYTDATHDVEIGGYTRFCNGTSTSWGETSSFQVTTQAPCSN